MSKKNRKHKKHNQVSQNTLNKEKIEAKVEEPVVVEDSEPAEEPVPVDEPTPVEEQALETEPVLEEEKEAPIVTEAEPDEVSTEEPTPVEEKKPVKEKKSKKNIILFIIILVGCIVILIDLENMNKKKQENKPTETPEEVVENVDDGVSPPSDAEIVDISSFDKNSANFKILCLNYDSYYKFADKEPVNSGEIITCSYYLYALDGFKIDTVFFNLEYGSELEMLDPTNFDEKLTTIKNNKIKDVMPVATNDINQSFKMNFKVKKNDDGEKLYVEAKDIVFKTIKNDYYRLDDVKVEFLAPSKAIYIYQTDELNEPYDSYIYAKNYPIAKDELQDNYYRYTLIDEYNCQERGCSFINSNGNYILIKDDGYVAYNYVTKKKTYLYDFDTTADIEIVADSELRGLIVMGDSEDDYGYGYYSLENNEYIFDIEPNQYFEIREGYLYKYGEGTDEEKFYDYQGNVLSPTIEMMYRIKGTDFYYLEGIGSMSGGPDVYFYNKDGKALFNGAAFGNMAEFEASDFMVSKNHNLLVREGKQFKEYTIDEEVVYESEEYKSFSLMGNGYIVAVDNNRTLKIIDERENVIHEFEQLDEDYYIHWALSYMDENEGIYILVEDSRITTKEKKKYIKKDDPEGTLEDYEGYDWGYEYWYNPTTGKSGKDVTFIGGYAKPILYLYPEEETKVTVNFEHEDSLTTTYPKFKDEWSVTAKPNGDLYDKDGKYYYGLYWEEDLNHPVDFHEGFYVTKDNAIEFLEEKLSIIGLNDRERNEFIMYWLPILEKNGQSLVYFELTEERDSYNKIMISPKPDSLLRMAIHVKKVNTKVDIKEEVLTPFERIGFTAVEWGGVVYN